MLCAEKAKQLSSYSHLIALWICTLISLLCSQCNVSCRSLDEVLRVRLREWKLNAIALYCPAPSVYGPWAVFIVTNHCCIFFFASDGMKCLCVVTLDTGSLNPPGFYELFLSCSVWHLSLCSTAVSSKAQESHTCLCFLLTCRHSNPGTCLGARYSNYSQTHPAN